MKNNFKIIESKWQKKWEEGKIFEVREDKKKRKFYCLEMFPYPSASGLHMGHAFNYTLGDIYSRFKRMKGFNVLYPMGYDALGLPAENAAIKAKTHPEEYTKKAIKNFMKQQKLLGLSYDWSRMINTSMPEYYKWDQWIFLKMLEKGIAYKKKSAVNWCSKCNGVLANEQVHNGKCWIHKVDVEIKHLEQWFFKITKYINELLKFDNLDWPNKTKLMQKNWIGKSCGTEIDFKIGTENWKIFTTRPDTIYGVTFMVVSAQHPKLMDLVILEQKKDVEKFLKKIKSVSEKELGELEKEGVFTGSYAINPLTKEKIPVYAGNFVIADYGSGMVMAVPGHDKRDFEFAKKYKLSVIRVIAKDAPIRSYLMGADKISDGDLEKLDIKIIEKTSEGHKKIEIPKKSLKKYEKLISDKLTLGFWNEYVGQQIVFIFKHKNGKTERIVLSKKTEERIDKLAAEFMDEKWDKSCVWKWLAENDFYTDLIVHTGEGKLINSEKFNGLNSKKAIEEITKYLKRKKLGRKVIQYKLRDWLISRQRYWGTPIPIIYCEKCGTVPVPEKELPVELPKNVKFGRENPLKTNEKWIKTKCPTCRGNALRETDTMDTFVNSSWYFLRYCDPNNSKIIFDKKKANYWCPIDQYIGGAEHACMHLIYFRFYTKFLRDMGLLEFGEPAKKLFHQGMLHGEDGNKMSKSLGNVINPVDMIKKYGTDSLRLALMSFASPDSDTNWDEKVLIGSFKFVNKVFYYFENIKIGKADARIENKLNKTIKEVTNQIENFKYNLAVIKIRYLFDSLPKETTKNVLEKSLKLLHPFCPHITEELWSKLGNKNFISLEKWPVADEKKINKKLEEQEQAAEKLVEDINHILKLVGKIKIKKVFVYVLPNEKKIYIGSLDLIKKRTGLDAEVYAVNDKNKYDPEKKSKKVKSGRPGIYLE